MQQDDHVLRRLVEPKFQRPRNHWRLRKAYMVGGCQECSTECQLLHIEEVSAYQRRPVPYVPKESYLGLLLWWVQLEEMLTAQSSGYIGAVSGNGIIKINLLLHAFPVVTAKERNVISIAFRHRSVHDGHNCRCTTGQWSWRHVLTLLNIIIIIIYLMIIV